MLVKDIEFNGRIYSVYSPGVILRSSEGKILDQLKQETPIIETRNVFQYIKKLYNLTPDQYTILVMFEGDSSKWPKCECGCGENVKLRGIGGFSKYVNQSHANRMTSLERSKLGTNPFSGENGSKLSHMVNMMRVSNGTHHFQGKVGSERASRKNKELSSKGLHSWQKLTSKFNATKNRFISAGDPSDICELYVASVNDHPELFKIGISVKSSGRLVLSQSNFSELRYDDIEVIARLPRVSVAQLEYDIKLKYNEYSMIGTETFPIEMKLEIVNFINETLHLYQ